MPLPTHFEYSLHGFDFDNTGGASREPFYQISMIQFSSYLDLLPLPFFKGNILPSRKNEKVKRMDNLFNITDQVSDDESRLAIRFGSDGPS